MIDKEILKLDLDLTTRKEVKELLIERLTFLDKTNILPKKYINKIESIHKNNYSVKIYLNKFLKDKKDLIILQSILGGDPKHIAITFRDYELGIKNFNRLFDVKRNVNGEFKYAKVYDITFEILSNLENE